MSGRARLPVLTGAGTCFFSIGLLIPVLPQYVTGPLDRGSALVGVLAAAPSVTALLVRPVVGRFADTRGHRQAAMAGAAVLAVTAFALLGAHTFPAVLACRAASGIGEAFAYVGLAAAGASPAGEESGTPGGITWFSIAVYTGLLAGAPTGAFVLGALGYAWVWALSGAVAGTAVASCLLLPGTRAAPAGTASSGPAPAEAAPARAAAPSRTPAPTAGPVRTAAARAGRTGGSPLVHRAGLLPGVAYGASIWGYTAFNTYIPLYGRHAGAHDVRSEYLVYGVVLLAVRILGHRVLGRLPPRRVAAASLAFTSAGLAWLLLLPTPSGLVTGTAVLATGQALGLPAFLTMGVGAVPAGQRGSVIATVTGFFDAGFLSAALGLGLVIQTLGLVPGFAVAAAVAAASLLLFLPWRRAVAPSALPSPPTTEE